jgi:cellulose synthase/poly-beta-1,6-N-acetylglucosamine synthase-like glycosyltransferase
VLLEADDEETPAALAAADPPGYFRAIVLPDSQPKTKPKACNVGLTTARGEFLVIYDAEDRPDPDQLKKAVYAFRRSGRRVVCLQAALNYWNTRDNALTRMFTLEYSFWFDYMLPGLYALRMPIPLGGTSNHFRTQALRDLGGWDPYNVTEDADLGIRASMSGYEVGIIDSTTFEEANRSYPNFIRQRSRWIKGYLQTVLVHSRRPVRLLREAGPKALLGFGLLIGGTPLTFLAMPPLILVTVAYALGQPLGWFPELPPWVMVVGITNLVLGNGVSVYIAMAGAFKRRNYGLVPWALLNPVYWLLHSVASYKALWQLITRPHYWEKTRHGLSDAGADAAEDRLGPDGPAVA